MKEMKIHFIGIGGIGVSALAQYYLVKGHEVSGSDLASSEITEALKKKGAEISIGEHKAENLPKRVNLVIYSPAVQPDNPELKEAKKRKINLQTYPQALGELTKHYYTIAVSGTHGKSTTTSMLGLLLVKAGLDPTVIVGTKLKEFGNSNCKVGKSKYLVIEADEHFASFLNYWPKIIVLTNIEADHLDYYKNLNNILKAFKKYIGHLPEDGYLVANKDDKNIKRAANSIYRLAKSIDYSLKQPEAGKLRKILKVPGEHNVSNALAALMVARTLNIPDKVSFKSLSEYRGVWRRFEEKTIIWRGKKIITISDYAHHPTEIKVTLKAAREKYLYPPKFPPAQISKKFVAGEERKLRRARKKIWCVYQPHQYHRTYCLFAGFVKVFRQAPMDKTIIIDIYDVAGREEKNIKKKVSSEKLVKAINKKNVIYLPKEKVLNYLKESSQFDVLIIMGAGDIYQLISELRR